MTVGWRAHDDMRQTYANNWHDGTPQDDLRFLSKVLESDDETLWEMIDACQNENRGVFVAEKYYPWDKIETVVKAARSGEKGSTG